MRIVANCVPQDLIFLGLFPPFPRKETTVWTDLFSVGHISIIYTYLHFPVVSLDLSGMWESLPACESCTFTHSCNLGGSCIFESDGLICFSKFLLNHLLVYKWHSKQQINEGAFLLCTVILRQTFLHTHTSSSYLIDTLRHHAWNMLLFTYLCL